MCPCAVRHTASDRAGPAEGGGSLAPCAAGGRVRSAARARFPTLLHRAALLPPRRLNPDPYTLNSKPPTSAPPPHPLPLECPPPAAMPLPPSPFDSGTNAEIHSGGMREEAFLIGRHLPRSCFSSCSGKTAFIGENGRNSSVNAIFESFSPHGFHAWRRVEWGRRQRPRHPGHLGRQQCCIAAPGGCGRSNVERLEPLSSESTRDGGAGAAWKGDGVVLLSGERVHRGDLDLGFRV